MVDKIAYLRRNPLLLLGALWPAILLVPHIPGIPRPSVDSLPWRQELVLSLLLGVSLTLILAQRFKSTWSIPRPMQMSGAIGLLFVIWIWFSALWARDTYPALHLALQWSLYLLFFALITFAPTRVIRASIVSLVLVVCILGVSSVVESWLGSPLTDGNLRVAVKPILRGSGTFGETMGVVSILFSSLALGARRLRNSLIFGMAATLGWLGTLQSLERAPFIATSIGLFIVLSIGVLLSRRYKVSAALAATLLGACLIQLIPVKQMAPEDASTVGRIKAAAASGDSSAQARFLLWGIAVEMLRHHPLTGVGGGNYQANYADARAQFAERNPQSNLVSFNEQLLPIFAHNEYMQILAELGAVGFLLFVLLALGLLLNTVAALRVVKRKLSVIGPAAAALTFAISSGASASSFRYLSGGLLFFFVAALITRNVCRSRVIVFSVRESHVSLNRWKMMFAGWAVPVGIAISLFSLQATGIVCVALAETSSDTSAREAYYRDAFRFYPGNTSAHFSYGMWLYGQRRPNEALPYMRRAVHDGLNSSICFQYLAAVEEAAGDLNGAEQTLATAVKVYPRSVFLLVRHSVALERTGKNSEAINEFSRALAIDPPSAKGWHNLIVKDIDASLTAAKEDSDVAGPGELSPSAAVLAVLQENEMKHPDLAKDGWRKRIRSAESSLK